MRSDPDVAALRAEVGIADVLANCAGYVTHGTVLDCDENVWDASSRQHQCALHASDDSRVPPCMLERKCRVDREHCVLRVIGSGYPTAASTARLAVIALTKSVAIDFVGRNIRVNAICPGEHRYAVDQRTHGGDGPQVWYKLEAVRQTYIDNQLNKRLGTSEEVAFAAVSGIRRSRQYHRTHSLRGWRSGPLIPTTMNPTHFDFCRARPCCRHSSAVSC